jgi:hypothetical protein
MAANAFIKELQSLGMGGRRSELLALYKIAVGVVARTADEPFRPKNQVPTSSERGVWPTKGATGVAQTVTLTYHDRTTGTIKQTWWRTVTPNGVTRERAEAMAIDAYSQHAESYGQDLIGAVHTSAYDLTPFASIP